MDRFHLCTGDCTEIPTAEVYRKIKADIGKIMRQLYGMKMLEIIKAEACPDHIYMSVSSPPNISVAQFMGYRKGKRYAAW